MRAHERFAIPDSPVDETRHELVALGIEPTIGARLRHTVGELPVAEVMIGCDRNSLRSRDGRLFRMRPVNMELPHVDDAVGEERVQLPAAGGDHDVRRAGGRKCLAVDVGIVQEVDVLHDDALLGGGQPRQHLRPIGDARVLLRRDRGRDAIVACACGDVIPIRPDGRTRVVREERAEELVAIVRAEGIGRGAHRVAHRVDALRVLRWESCAAARGRQRRRGRRIVRWRLVERHCRAWLASHPRHTELRRIGGCASGHLIRPRRSPREDRHDDQPAIGQLVVADDGVTVVARLAWAGESLEDVVRGHRSIKHPAGGVEHRTLLREGRHARIHGLHDVIGPHGKAVVGGIAAASRALRAGEAHAESIEARGERRGGPVALRALLGICAPLCHARVGDANGVSTGGDRAHNDEDRDGSLRRSRESGHCVLGERARSPA